MKIYTRTGDTGETSLLGGTRVSKGHLRIEAYGCLDELNSFVGLLADQDVNSSRREFLVEIQNSLFVMSSILSADPGHNKFKLPAFDVAQIDRLEQEIDNMNLDLPELKNFILPGGNPSVSICHVVRSVCRRSERAVARLADASQVDFDLIKYLNRLSDYFFVLARKIGKELGAEEVAWRP